MRISWLVLVCSSIAFTLAGCAEGPASGPGVRYATSSPHVRETTRLAATLTRQATVQRPAEPLRLVTDPERRALAHK